MIQGEEVETEQFSKWRELVDSKCSARRQLAVERTENNGRESEKAERLGEFFKTAIKEIGEGKFGCSVADCDKKFRGTDFVKAIPI